VLQKGRKSLRNTRRKKWRVEREWRESVIRWELSPAFQERITEKMLSRRKKNGTTASKRKYAWVPGKLPSSLVKKGSRESVGTDVQQGGEEEATLSYARDI